MYLTDLLHIQDHYRDEQVDAVRNLVLIDFSKRQKIADTINAMLRHQSKPYKYSENPQLISFIESQLSLSSNKDDDSLWRRSQELQQAELAHADMKKNLEAAGF